MKQCTKCKETKPLPEFTKGPDNGYRYQCRACNNAYQLNAERRKKNSATYYAKRKQTNPALFMWKQAKHRAQWDYDDMEFTITVDDIVVPETVVEGKKKTKRIPMTKAYKFPSCCLPHKPPQIKLAIAS